MAEIRNQKQKYLDDYGVDFYRDPQSMGSSRVLVKYLRDDTVSTAAHKSAIFSLAFLPIIIKFL